MTTYLIYKRCPACDKEFRQRSQNSEGREYCSQRCRRAQSSVDRWNAKNPVGVPVTLLMDDGSTIETTTCSAAIVLPSGAAVIWVVGVVGCYALERCKPVRLTKEMKNV